MTRNPKDRVYKQVDGVAMGGPLGPSLAKKKLGHIEETILFNDGNFFQLCT